MEYVMSHSSPVWSRPRRANPERKQRTAIECATTFNRDPNNRQRRSEDDDGDAADDDDASDGGMSPPFPDNIRLSEDGGGDDAALLAQEELLDGRMIPAGQIILCPLSPLIIPSSSFSS
jgi:hypothetical protein